MALTIPVRIAALLLAAGFQAAPALASSTAAPALELAQADEPEASEQPAEPAEPEEAHPAEPEETEPEEAAPEAFQPNDEQIDSFVTATVRIINIQRDAQEEITAAKEAAEQQQLRDQALQMIVAVVEEEGLTVDQYNGIVQHVENDPALGESVKQRIQDQILKNPAGADAAPGQPVE